MFLHNYIYILVYLSFMAFSAVRLLTYLHIFQQEEYDGKRFLAWLWHYRVFDRKLSIALFILGAFWFALSGIPFLLPFLTFLAFAIVTAKEKDPRKKAKKKLAMTNRAKRIFVFAFLFANIPALIMLYFKMPWIWILFVQELPLLLVAANTMLKPYENSNQKKFWNEAHEKLQELNPVTIGITGSFGKTSIKHILGHILENEAPALITPGSVNTPMGIARIVREELNDHHKYFICEMGAYGPGSIKRLCNLAPPSHAIISSIGHAHYERFKSLEAVAETKFELAEATIEKEGKIVVHANTLRFPYTAHMKNNYPESFIVCGPEEDHTVMIDRADQTREGLDMRLRIDGKRHKVYAPLYGLHHIDNIALAFVMAIQLGMEPEAIIARLRTLPQIPHRLEVKKVGPATIIDDAYNSNPVGFQSALDLLYLLGWQGRKILITPGMVELGTAHDEMHYKLGVNAARRCDIVLVVQQNRIPTFVEGFKKEARKNQMLIEFDSYNEAQKWVNRNMRQGDTVLIENDLPDLYENVPKL